MDVFKEAGVPDGVINVVFGDPEMITKTVLNSPDFSGLHFTGSTQIFKKLWKNIGENISNYKTYPKIVFQPFKFQQTHLKMFQRSYETVFILTPVLSDVQMKDTVDKFVNLLKEEGADVINVENWGLKKMAYTIEKKTTGFYVLVEFKADPTLIRKFEIEIRRDEKVMRFLTTVLDKHAIVYAQRRRKGEFNKKVEAKEEQAQ